MTTLRSTELIIRWEPVVADYFELCFCLIHIDVELKALLPAVFLEPRRREVWEK